MPLCVCAYALRQLPHPALSNFMQRAAAASVLSLKRFPMLGITLFTACPATHTAVYIANLLVIASGREAPLGLQVKALWLSANCCILHLSKPSASHPLPADNSTVPFAGLSSSVHATTSSIAPCRQQHRVRRQFALHRDRGRPARRV